MAQITLSARSVPTPYRSHGGTFDLRSFTASTVAGSTAKIVYGDVVDFVTGRVFKSAPTSNAVISTSILGVAMEADGSTATSSATEGSSVVVCCATKDTEFKFATKIAGASHGSSLIGTRGALSYDSTLSIYIAGTNSTAGENVLLFTDILDAGTTNGFMVAKFVSTNVARLISAAF